MYGILHYLISITRLKRKKVHKTPFNYDDFYTFVYRDRHDSNSKNRRFAEVTKHSEEYLGVLDINFHVSWNQHFRNVDADADANANADAELSMPRFPSGAFCFSQRKSI